MERLLLRDDQWARLEPLCEGKKQDRGVTAKDNRLFLEAVLWIARTGSPWRDLPKEFGNWHSAYVRFARWCDKGTWARLAEAVSGDPDLEMLFIDSTIVRAHQHAAGAKKRRAARHRTFAWRTDDKNSCSSGWIGKSRSFAFDWWRSCGHNASPILD